MKAETPKRRNGGSCSAATATGSTSASADASSAGTGSAAAASVQGVSPAGTLPSSSHPISDSQCALIDAKPRPLHFMEADARFRGPDVVLRIAQYRDDRDLHRIEEAHQRAEDHGVGFDPVRDHGHAVLGALNLRVQQQIRDATRYGLNVDVGRQHRNQYAMGVAGEFDILVLVDGRRGVDDDAFHLVRNPHRERPRDFGGHVERRNTVDARHGFGALGEPARARRLRILILKCGKLAASGIEGCEVRRNRGLAGTAFRVQHHDFEGHFELCALHACRTLSHRRAYMQPSAARNADRSASGTRRTSWASRRPAADRTKIGWCAACRPHIATHRER